MALAAEQRFISTSGIKTPGEVAAKLVEMVEELDGVWEIQSISIADHGRAISATALIKRVEQPATHEPHHSYAGA